MIMKLFRAPSLAGRSTGVGLVELLIGVAIVGILAAVALPSMADFIERRRVVAVAGEVSNIIAFAKAETNVIARAVSVHMENGASKQLSCIAVVTQANVPNCKCYNPPSQICTAAAGGSKLLRLFQVPYADGVEFSARATNWGPAHEVMGFNRANRLQAEKDVQISVKGRRTGVELRIDINEAGRATVCSKVGRLGGYPTCV
ncbi:MULTISPECIES: Tfp pilus assembly protein FimT/FimU [unclassified Roseateles]|uniref:pilus assembly FimT family protein n=1 Tax=unclassified Roseateles TaxID=2626991 RepID=UPI0012E3848C|nr:MULTISPECIES: hypothetical protein [unclassified Roseateles]